MVRHVELAHFEGMCFFQLPGLFQGGHRLKGV